MCAFTRRWRHTVACEMLHRVSSIMDDYLAPLIIRSLHEGSYATDCQVDVKPAEIQEESAAFFLHCSNNLCSTVADEELLCCSQAMWSLKGGPAVMLFSRGFGLLCPKGFQVAHLRCHSLGAP